MTKIKSLLLILALVSCAHQSQNQLTETKAPLKGDRISKANYIKDLNTQVIRIVL